MRSACRNVVVLLVVWLSVAAVRAHEPEGHWYKGNLHTHSLWSDGNDFPEMIADWYQRSGYHFLGLSDHNILSRGEKWIADDLPAQRGAIGGVERYRERFGDDWVTTREVEGKTQIRLKTLEEFRPMFEKPGEFLMLEAEEITDRFQSLPIHVNANNLAEYIRPQGGASVRETIANNIRAVTAQSREFNRPILAHLNHPNFGYAVTAEDMAAVTEERFFEVYNGHPSVGHLGDAEHVGLERMWDIANTIRVGKMKQPPLLGLATDDSHNYFGLRGASPGRGWVMVRAPELAADAIVDAIQRGDFYASSGVALKSIQTADDTIVIDVEPADGVQYTIEFIGTLIGYDDRSEPVLDKDGNAVTRSYSADVGKVLQRSEGTSATYKLTGKELYVRATITSTKPHPNPSFDKQTEQAWTQPFGWQRHLKEN